MHNTMYGAMKVAKVHTLNCDRKYFINHHSILYAILFSCRQTPISIASAKNIKFNITSYKSATKNIRLEPQLQPIRSCKDFSPRTVVASDTNYSYSFFHFTYVFYEVSFLVELFTISCQVATVYPLTLIHSSPVFRFNFTSGNNSSDVFLQL